ncbi:MAG: hypothetical protein JWM33_3290 [Caulobacteraceae bacterium]|nr:hypothetical protein [Caulobacteraceae bacterium]
MRRWMIWGVLAVAAGLLGGSAIATPMSDQDYATQVAQEVDLQNMSCSEIDELWHVFDEMTGRCPAAPSTFHLKPTPGSRTGLSITARPSVRSTSLPPTSNGLDPCATMPVPSPVDCLPPYAYTPPRLCPGDLAPTYRLSPDLYAQLGTEMRDILVQSGVPWDIDIQPGEIRGRVMSGDQIFVPAPINALARQLAVASRLKNCRGL